MSPFTREQIAELSTHIDLTVLAVRLSVERARIRQERRDEKRSGHYEATGFHYTELGGEGG